MEKIVNLEEAVDISKKSRQEGKTTVLAGGCFDILHTGHNFFLKKAKMTGDILLVALESDQNVRRLKGKGRPVNKQKNRAEVLARLGMVDYVLLLPEISSDSDYFDLVKKITPSIIAVTEGDLQLENKKKQAKMIGGKVMAVAKLLKEHSTTKILTRNIRVFLAIGLPKNVRDEFSIFFEKVKQIKEVKWEQSEKLHLTLVFLGFVKRENLEKIKSIMEEITVQFDPFSLQIMPNLGGFPSLSNPRVLWLRLEGDLEKINKIVSLLQKNLYYEGFVFDKRPFSAHLTLGRFREGIGKTKKEEIVKKVDKFILKKTFEFTVNGVSLYQSQLTPKGSYYTLLSYANFRD